MADSHLNQTLFIDMNPEGIETHAIVKLEVTNALANLNKKTKLGRVFPGRTLLTNVRANLATEPDVTFVSWESLESGRVRLVPRAAQEEQFIELEGSPDLVVEVVSQSSVAKDTRLLRQHYHLADIPEYWLSDARGKELDFQILWREEKGYQPAPLRGDWQESQVFRRRFRLNRHRGRMKFWEYTLQVKLYRQPDDRLHHRSQPRAPG